MEVLALIFIIIAAFINSVGQAIGAGIGDFFDMLACGLGRTDGCG
jgi:hypothetical protein